MNAARNARKMICIGPAMRMIHLALLLAGIAPPFTLPIVPPGRLPVAQPGTLPQFSLIDTNGYAHTPADWTGKRAIVLVFMSTDCPLSNSYVPELNRIEQKYASQGCGFYAVQGDATVPDDEVRRHVREFKYGFPYLLDPAVSLATYTGAAVTPEAAVLSPRGELLYLGRIDNRLQDYGEHRTQITEFDLRNALDAILSGKPVPRVRTRALGCAITRKD